MTKLFISYRRSDSRPIVERIHDRLVTRYGKKNVFLDVDLHIPFGSDFAKILKEKLEASDILIVVIGNTWVNELAKRANSEDFVRFEVEAGLQQTPLVIPILVNGASVPLTHEILPNIKDLLSLNFLEVLSNPYFNTSMEFLINTIEDFSASKSRKQRLPVKLNRRRLVILTSGIITILFIATILITIINSNIDPTLISANGQPTIIEATNTPQAQFNTIPTNTVNIPSITSAFITPTSGENEPILNTPLPSTPKPQIEGLTTSPTSELISIQPTVDIDPNIILQEIAAPQNTQNTLSTVGVAAYQYGVGFGDVFNFNGIQLTGGVMLFAPNPADANSFMRTDQNGMLLYKPIGVNQEGVMTYAPIVEGFAIANIFENKNRVLEIDWSADGTRFTFRIDPPPGTDSGNAGVWFWQPEITKQSDPTYEIIRDCFAPGAKPCEIVNKSNANLWKTREVEWSPIRGDYFVLLTVSLPEEGRSALAVVPAVRDATFAAQAPVFTRYDFGYWTGDGQSIIVSGRRPDGRVIIGRVNRGLTSEQVIFDASAAGLWMQNAIQAPNGQIYALGRPGGPFDGGAVALYDGAGNAISSPIGAIAPEDVRWYPDRSAVVVSVQGRQYTVRTDGSIADTTDLARNPSFGSGGVGAAPLPQGVIQGSQFSPGQQVRVITTNLNVRQDPTTGSIILTGLLLGDYAAIIAGPYNNEGYTWWKVQTANNTVGWLAGTINGALTISP